MQIAERWAYQCTGGHDHNRLSSRFQVGQNVAKSTMRISGGGPGVEVKLDADWAFAVKNWYDEVRMFDKKTQKGLGLR